MTTMILDHTGQPFTLNASGARTKAAATLVSSLRGLNEEPITRAANPYESHSWVYAAAGALAINASQAPVRIFRETDKSSAARMKRRAARGYKPKKLRGWQRRAVKRFLEQPLRRRCGVIRGVEVDEDHPLNDLLLKPNPEMTFREMVMATIIYLSIFGEAFWIKLNGDMKPALPGEPVFAIEIVSPNCMRDHVVKNELAYWEVTIERGSVIDAQWATQINVDRSSVCHFKYFNPRNKIRGLSPLVPASMSVVLDLASLRHNKAIMENGADPGGILVDRSPNAKGGEAMNDLRKLLKQEYGGTGHRGDLMILPANIDYIRTGLVPKDMDWEILRRMTREDVLAVYGVPKSIVSVTDDLNYSIQTSQDKNFWDKRLIPIILLLEAKFDTGIMWLESDDVFMGFDLSGIEALRSGLKDAIANAKDLAQEALHMPPRQAFEIAGIEVEEYPGIDDAFGSPLTATPISDILEFGGGLGGYDPAPAPAEDPNPKPPKDPAVEPPEVVEESLAELDARRKRIIRARRASWDSIARGVFIPNEKVIAKSWVAWIRRERDIALAAIDQQSRNIRSWHRPTEKALSIEAILSSLVDMQERLRKSARPAFIAGATRAYEFTTRVDLAGITLFEVTDPRLARVILDRETLLVGRTPVTIQKNLRKSLTEGFNSGETLAEIRARVSKVYGAQGSPAKTLQVARTESAGLSNGVREEMFDGANVTASQWFTANDEHVRPHHVLFGQAGSKPRGFDYLSLVSGNAGGRLRFPNDPEGPAEEVINCRCFSGPVLE